MTCCNVRLWYLNVVSDDIFNANLNEDQQNLKDSIESFVTKASKSKENKKTGCHILEMYNDMLKETFQYGPNVPLVQVPCSETLAKIDHDNASQKNIGYNVKSKIIQSKKTVEEKTDTNEQVPEKLNALDVMDKEEQKARPYGTSDQHTTNMDMLNDDIDLDETDILSDPIKIDGTQVNEKELHNETILDEKMAADDYRQDGEGKDPTTTKSKNTADESQINTDKETLHERERKNETGLRNDKHTILDRKENTLAPKVGKSNTEFIELVKTMRGIISETVVFPKIKKQKNDRNINTESAKQNPKAKKMKTKLHKTKVKNENIENAKVGNIKHIGRIKGEHDEQNSVADNHSVNKETSKQHHTKFGLCFSPVCVKIDIFSFYARESSIFQRKHAEQNTFDQLQSETAAVENITKKENAKDGDSIKVISHGESSSNIIEASVIHAKIKPHLRKKGFIRCPERRSCSTRCHLLYSFRHCLFMEGQGQHESNITENTQTYPNDLSYTASKRPRKYQKNCHQKKSCNNYCYLVNMLRHCLPVDRLTNQSGIAPGVDNREHKTDEGHHLNDNKDMLDKELKVDSMIKTENIKSNEEEPFIIRELNDITAKQSAGTEEQTKRKHIHLNQELEAFPFERLEKIINQQTDEYGRKIQTLELMIIKLENQVLFEKLEKQNHSSTIMRLENMILKLENDLLRMYKNHETLRQESEKCSKQHHQFLEIVQQQEKKFKTYPELPDKTSESLELISKHQMKIKELSQTINNQSKILDQLKSKSDYLEEQNDILRQMITNQTVFMNQIVTHMANLTEQNMKYKGELDDLRKSISDMNSTKIPESISYAKESGIFMNNLDSLASDGKIRIDNIDINTDNKHEIRSPTTYCNYSCMISRMKKQASCHYYSVVNENKMVPYKTLFWEKCSHDLSAESRKVTDNVDLPQVLDNEVVRESEDSIDNERKEKMKVNNPEGETNLATDENLKARSPTVLKQENLEPPIPTDMFENNNDNENKFQKHSKSEEEHLKTEKLKKAKQVNYTIQLDNICVMTRINLFECLCKFKSMPHFKNITNNLFSEDKVASIEHQADLQKLEDTFGQSDDFNKPLITKFENQQANGNEAKADEREEQNKQNYDNTKNKHEQLNPMDIPRKENSAQEKEENTIEQKSTTNQHQIDSVSDDKVKDKENNKTVLGKTENDKNIPKRQMDEMPELSKKEKRETDSEKVKTEKASSKKEQTPEAKEHTKEKKGKLQSKRKIPIYLNRQQKEPKGKMVFILSNENMINHNLSLAFCWNIKIVNRSVALFLCCRYSNRKAPANSAHPNLTAPEE